jgi:glycosyltransferase involved in cell wall biosynthesis
MKGMRILMISPTPTHPQDAGNRARIFRLAEQFRSLGCNLYFVYYEMEEANLEGMREYWGEQLFIFPGKATAVNTSSKLNALLIRLGEWLRSVGIEHPSLYGRGLGVDDWYSPDLGKAIRHLHEKESFQMVWVEYVFLSKILNSFDSSVMKVIDTHDVFSNRHKRMVTRGMKPEWFSTTPELERKGLDRADWVVAIHEQDAEFFKTLGLSRVVTIGHLIQIHPAKDIPPRNRILFMGSDNSINLKAWEYFTQEILPQVEKGFPGTSIRVAGKICRRIPENARYQKLGVIEDLHALYASTTVAINPLTWGTGLKIKTIEPLAYGCPVVTTPSGIEGIEEAENRGILVGRTPKGFAECIERLLTCPSLREEQSRLAQGFLRGYIHRNQQGLLGILGDHKLYQRKECVT